VKEEKNLNEIPHLFTHWSTMKKSEKKYENISPNISYITEFTLICNTIRISYERTFQTTSITALLAGIPSSRLHRLITPDDVLIQFDLLMMSAVTLETCRDMK